MKKVRILLLFSFFAAVSQFSAASVRLPKVISSNMVLQREMPVKIWGEATPGEKVTINFGEQVKSATTLENGKWFVTLDPLKASFISQNLKISTPDKDTVLTNILVGEVWLCGGQSNMEYPMRRGLKKYAAPARGNDLAESEWKSGGSKNIRLMLVEKKNSLPDCTSKGWEICSDTSLAPFSAVGYYFGKYLQEDLDVPVGLISSSWGGSRIERWTPVASYENSDIFKDEFTAKPGFIDGIDAGLHFNSMISPLGPYGIRGFIWYQGESNLMIHDNRYVEKTVLLTDAWRKLFESPEAPFYYVQVAPYSYTKRKDKLVHAPETMAEFCELQTKCLAIPGTGQVIVTDLVDDLSNIHPSYKWEVGRRLSLVALAKTYGKKDLVFSGPSFKSMDIRKKKVFLTFENIGAGLTAGIRNQQTNEFEKVENADLNWFTIAGEDGKFYPAKAVIKDNQVVVSSPEVKKPKYVRFAWDEKAMPNFFNKEGLPAVPFRTGL